MSPQDMHYGRQRVGDEYEEELEQIRRYEDFTTIDWIQESIAERNRRIREEQALSAYRGPHGEITAAWMWAQFKRLLSAGESWFVMTLTG
ncbi:hypothetical protein ID866_1392 [Astraeus odoratus]|nr:hypothetical protein ID866_1392 [Astraeus odoratus]